MIRRSAITTAADLAAVKWLNQSANCYQAIYTALEEATR